MDFYFDNERPIYLQLLEQLKTAIIAGDFAPGEKLPSVRELALSAKVNPNTVQKALGELERQGLIFTERTNGKFVSEETAVLERSKAALAAAKTAKFLEEMQSIGITPSEALDFVKKTADGLLED